MRPFTLTTRLMDHQQRAVDKLKPVRVGALFMDMGTGKTLTTIEIIRKRVKKIDRVIWICPVSLKYTTESEIHKHIKEKQRVYVFDDKTTAENIPDADWYIVGTESIGSSARVFFAFNALVTDNSCVVVDESVYIKSPTAIRTQRIVDTCRHCRYRFILTGTPMTQGVQDLYTQMEFLSPQILGYRSYYSFANNHLEYDKRYPGRVVSSHNHEYLAEKLNPFVYQVKKEECLDLPEKFCTRVYVPLSGEVQFYYYQVRGHYLEMLDRLDENSWMGMQQISLIIFALFTGLQKVLSGYTFNDDKFDGKEIPEARINALKDTLLGIDKDEKVIIWAKFHHDLDCIETMLKEEFGEESYVEFSGRLNAEEREESIKKFRKDARFFVATPASGGHGLTLNEASYVVYYNNSFKYAERIQSEDRCHRIGQSKNVTYIDLVTPNTVDEKIIDSIEKKEDALKSFEREIENVKDNKEKAMEFFKNI